jgi:uncharacterized protein DUF4352
MTYQPQPDLPNPGMPERPPKKTHTFRNVVLGILVGGFLLIGGCVALVGYGASELGTEAEKAGIGDASPAPTPGGDAPYDPTTPPAAEETTPPPAATSDVAKVGAAQWFDYEDGLRVQVTKVQRFRISSTAAGGKPGDQGVKVTVTIQNKTGSTFDANLASVKLQSGPNGDEADTVYDSASNIGSGFEGSIVNGRKKTAVYGFAVPKGHKAVMVEVAPSWDHDASHFEGTVK